MDRANFKMNMERDIIFEEEPYLWIACKRNHRVDSLKEELDSRTWQRLKVVSLILEEKLHFQLVHLLIHVSYYVNFS